MNTVIRCHIKNIDRLSLLERSILSWQTKGLSKVGELHIVDDHSPMNEEVKALCAKHNIQYHAAEGYADTKNGLVESLKYANGGPIMCCVDDLVFGKGTVERVESILTNDIPNISEFKYGMIGMFACYGDNTRNELHLEGEDLWIIPNDIIYALVCHIYSPALIEVLLKEWEGIKNGTIPDPCCCDDIWVARICAREGFVCLNTMKDYAQHTGANNRTFGDNQIDKGSEYTTDCFVGE